jgi:hypothetical protein
VTVPETLPENVTVVRVAAGVPVITVARGATGAVDPVVLAGVVVDDAGLVAPPGIVVVGAGVTGIGSVPIGAKGLGRPVGVPCGSITVLSCNAVNALLAKNVSSSLIVFKLSNVCKKLCVADASLDGSAVVSTRVEPVVVNARLETPSFLKKITYPTAQRAITTASIIKVRIVCIGLIF